MVAQTARPLLVRPNCAALPCSEFRAARAPLCCRCIANVCAINGCTAFSCWQSNAKQNCKTDGTGCAVSAGCSSSAAPQYRKSGYAHALLLLACSWCGCPQLRQTHAGHAASTVCDAHHHPVPQCALYSDRLSTSPCPPPPRPPTAPHPCCSLARLSTRPAAPLAPASPAPTAAPPAAAARPAAAWPRTVPGRRWRAGRATAGPGMLPACWTPCSGQPRMPSTKSECACMAWRAGAGLLCICCQPAAVTVAKGRCSCHRRLRSNLSGG